MGPAPSCTVVICHHTGRLIDRCLVSVQQSRGVVAEVIVVSSDLTYTPPVWVRLLRSSAGPAQKRNEGAALSHAPYLIFLDDDVEVKPDCFAEFIAWMKEHPTCGMAFAKIYKMAEGRRNEFDDCGSWLTWTGFLYSRASTQQRDAGQYDQACRCLASKSATCAIRREVFWQLRGFDGAYYILGEETDLAWRVWLQGGEVWYVPQAISWHAFGCEDLKPKATYYTIDRTITSGCRNYLSLLTTNLGCWRLLVILPWHLLAWGLATLGFALRGDGARAWAILRGVTEYLDRLPASLAKRAQVQATRQVSDRILWPLIAVRPSWGYYRQRLWRYWTTQLHG